MSIDDTAQQSDLRRHRQPLIDWQSFSVRLVAGLAALVLITTLSAGVPALWIARSQLERQAGEHLLAVQRATASLYTTHQGEINDRARLLAERPTFQRLVTEGTATDMTAYLEAFRIQSGLDYLVVCSQRLQVTAGASPADSCSLPFTPGYGIAGGVATLAAETLVLAGEPEHPLGSVLAGVLLDEAFLKQIAANTGTEQTVLLADGMRVASSRPDLLPAGTLAAASTGAQAMPYSAQNHKFLTAAVPLDAGEGQATLLAEVALPVSGLVTAERQATAILVTSTLLVALIAMSAGIWAIRRLTAPLERLTQTAELISRGDFAAPVTVLAGPTEVTTLATALRQSQTTMLNALQERSEARDWLDSLIQSIVEGVITFDTRGRVTFMSHGAERILGRSGDAAIGLPVADQFQLAEPGATFLDLIPPAGSKRQIEVISPQGKPTVLAITGARLAPPSSPVPQVALVLRDVTEEEALRGLRSNFLANISHEFRTPLSTLNASMELLLDEEQNLSAVEMRNLLQPTHLSLVSLQTLIDNLLESSSIEAGRFTIRKRVVVLNQVISEAMHIVNPLLTRRGQSVSIAEPAQLPPLHADPTRLIQVLVNLLSNASKYSPIGQPVEVIVATNQSSLRVSVADRGPGIPEGERDQLFRRFVRLDAQAGEQYGIGLGLYVVKTIVEAHQGRLGVDDRPGGGSVFWFELPVATTPSREGFHEGTGS